MLRRPILLMVTGLVTAVVVVAIALSVVAGHPASAATGSGIVVAHINGITGGQEHTGVACAVTGDSDAGNIFQVANFDWGLTQSGVSSTSGGGSAGAVKSGSPVFSATTGWDTPQIESLLAQSKTTAASFCIYQSSGNKGLTLLETYDFTTCFVAGLSSSVAGSSVTATDTVTLDCAALKHTVFTSGGQSQTFTCKFSQDTCGQP
ncbi:MAG TPA: hypothetical protein VF120_16930 [Ktedonobacterales bacterium]